MYVTLFCSNSIVVKVNKTFPIFSGFSFFEKKIEAVASKVGRT